jgi:hypothetical protein
LTAETDPDKKAMMERLLTKVNHAVDNVEKALSSKQGQEEAKQVR